MKLSRPYRRSLRFQWWPLVVIALLGVAGLGGGLWHQHLVQTNRPAEALTTDDRPVGEVAYSAATDHERNAHSDPRPADVTDTPTPVEPPIAADKARPIPVTITYADGDPLQVGVLIGEPLADGECHLRLSGPGTPITTKAPLFINNRHTTCQALTVSEHLTPGVWRANLTVTANGRTGHANTEVHRP